MKRLITSLLNPATVQESPPARPEPVHTGRYTGTAAGGVSRQMGAEKEAMRVNAGLNRSHTIA